MGRLVSAAGSAPAGGKFSPRCSTPDTADWAFSSLGKSPLVPPLVLVDPKPGMPNLPLRILRVCGQRGGGCGGGFAHVLVNGTACGSYRIILALIKRT